MNRTLSLPTAASGDASIARLVITSAGILLVLSLLTGLAYPLLVTVIARLAFPAEAAGSVVTRGGQVVGSRLVGQAFSDAKYFWGRPSATTPVPYDGRASAGSNLGPSNEALTSAARARIEALRSADPASTSAIPVDLVTASASGLDPHITPAAAAYQVPRVARARGLSEARVRALVGAHTEGRSLGVLGEPRVNVLELNLDLDAKR